MACPFVLPPGKRSRHTSAPPPHGVSLRPRAAGAGGGVGGCRGDESPGHWPLPVGEAVHLRTAPPRKLRWEHRDVGAGGGVQRRGGVPGVWTEP